MAQRALVSTTTHFADDYGLETIDFRAWRGKQSFELQAVVRTADGTRYRLQIDRDAYDFQSSASIDRWDGDMWRTVHSIPYAYMDGIVNGVSYVDGGLDRGDLTQKQLQSLLIDARELARVATAVTR